MAVVVFAQWAAMTVAYIYWAVNYLEPVVFDGTALPVTVPQACLPVYVTVTIFHTLAGGLLWACSDLLEVMRDIEWNTRR